VSSVTAVDVRAPLHRGVALGLQGKIGMRHRLTVTDRER
jgi:hypothetical protein